MSSGAARMEEAVAALAACAVTVAVAVAVDVAAGVGIAGCACENRIGIDGATDGGGSDYWDPPIENLGEPGWRESVEPWCPGILDRVTASYDIWSYDGGVYVVAGEINADLGNRPYNQIFFNDGIGWEMAYEGEVEDLTNCLGAINSITGVPGGPLFAWNDELEPGSCPLIVLEEGALSQETGFMPRQVFAVGPALAWACTDLGLLEFDGDSWSRRDPPVDCPEAYVVDLWADATSLFAVGTTGLAYRLEGPEWIEIDTGTFSPLQSVWGFTGTDVWIGAGDGKLIHYDGTGSEEVEWPRPAGDAAVRDMWGKDGVLFIITAQRLVEWDGSGFSVLLDTDAGDGLEGIQISAIWGNSPGEVFLAVVDEDHVREGCGVQYLLWWDGSEFHWF